MKRRFQQGTVFHHPPLNSRVVDRHTTFLHEFFDMPVAQGIGDIPSHPHQNNPSMWPQLSSPLEHFFLSLSLLLLSWCALDWTAHILVASASELASHLTRPVTVSASCIPRTRLTLALIPCPCSGDS